MIYRPEIDGLRTLAVLPVIAFHAGLGPFTGGFVGVDVFFVISGYLITCILLKDLSTGNFTLWRFYERRARRILPALFVVVVVCLPFAWMWMLPDAFAAFGRSVAAVGLFASNILFWREAGYFAAAAEVKPLLHTWSLAVEEQYYLLFPPVLALIWRWGHRPMFWITAGVALASLMLAHWSVRVRPDAAFYLAPTRAWELLAGSLTAMLAQRHAAHARGGLALLGLLMIAGALLFYDKDTPSPSAWTLVPVIGTVLIIRYAQAGTWVAQLLSLPVMVGIGLISYSAYLWHQPLFAFARIRALDTPSPEVMALLGLASLGLAYVTWRYVEQPFRAAPKSARTGKPASRQAGILVASAGALAALVGIGLALPQMERQLPAGVEIAVAKPEDRHACTFNNRFDEAQWAACLSKVEAKPKILMVGDSHGRVITPALRAALAKDGKTLISFTHTGCYPIPGTTRLPMAAQQSCQSLMARAWDIAVEDPDVPLVVFSRWTLNLAGTRFDNQEGGREHGAPVNTQVRDLNPGMSRAEALAAHTVAVLSDFAADRPVIAIGPFPEAGWDVPLQLAKMALFRKGNVLELSTAQTAQHQRMKPAGDLMQALSDTGVKIVPLTPLFCDTQLPGRCVNAASGQIFYTDDDHPSALAAQMIARAVVKVVPD